MPHTCGPVCQSDGGRGASQTLVPAGDRGHERRKSLAPIEIEERSTACSQAFRKSPPGGPHSRSDQNLSCLSPTKSGEFDKFKWSEHGTQAIFCQPSFFVHFGPPKWTPLQMRNPDCGPDGLFGSASRGRVPASGKLPGQFEDNATLLPCIKQNRRALASPPAWCG